MSDDGGMDAIRFYFSFRSPYARLAAERLEAELADLGLPIESIPIYPSPELFPNDPSTLPQKSAYLLQDVPRLARAQGAGKLYWGQDRMHFLRAAVLRKTSTAA